MMVATRPSRDSRKSWDRVPRVDIQSDGRAIFRGGADAIGKSRNTSFGGGNGGAAIDDRNDRDGVGSAKRVPVRRLLRGQAGPDTEGTPPAECTDQSARCERRAVAERAVWGWRDRCPEEQPIPTRSDRSASTGGDGSSSNRAASRVHPALRMRRAGRAELLRNTPRVSQIREGTPCDLSRTCLLLAPVASSQAGVQRP
jgi:hypothetical protein